MKNVSGRDRTKARRFRFKPPKNWWALTLGTRVEELRQEPSIRRIRALFECYWLSLRGLGSDEQFMVHDDEVRHGLFLFGVDSARRMGMKGGDALYLAELMWEAAREEEEAAFNERSSRW